MDQLQNPHYPSAEEQKKLQEFYGPNKIMLKLKSIPKMIVEEIVSYYFFIIVVEYLIEVWNGLYMYGNYQLLRNLSLIILLIYNQFKNQKKLAKIYDVEKEGSVLRTESGEVRKMVLNQKEISVGDIVELQEGKIDMDMIILEGTCLVDESNLTGESIPLYKIGVQ